MNVWQLATDCNKDAVLMVEPRLDAGGYYRRNFMGNPMRENWQVPPIELVYPKRRLRDFVSMSLSAPVISEKAKQALEPVMGEQCEILPLIELRETQYYAVNVLNAIDCLDVENSDIWWSPDLPKRISRISRHVFFADKIPDSTVIFKIPNVAISDVFVTRRFVDAVIANSLKGAAFLDPAQDNLILAALDKPTNVVPGLPK